MTKLRPSWLMVYNKMAVLGAYLYPIKVSHT